jgi:hypothetical protein
VSSAARTREAWRRHSPTPERVKVDDKRKTGGLDRRALIDDGDGCAAATCGGGRSEQRRSVPVKTTTVRHDAYRGKKGGGPSDRFHDKRTVTLGSGNLHSRRER